MRRPLVLLVCMTLAACVPAPPGRTSRPTGGPGPTATDQPPDRPSVAPTSSPSFVRPTPRPSPTFLVYEVQAGDTLTSIARLFGTTARSIAYWNRSRYASLDPDSPTYQPGLIKVGWLLHLIPTAEVDEDELPEPTAGPTADPTPEPTPVS